MKKTVVIATALLFIQIPLLALVLLQERTWGGPQFDEGSGVATAPDNSVYVTGTTLTFGAGDRDAFLLKYDATGALAWQRTFGTAPTATLGDEFGRAVAVSPDGQAIYITGQFGNGSLFLARFDPAGTLVWQRTWGENGSIGNGVAATNTDVYVTGGTNSLERQSDAILLKFNADGTLQWNIAWGGDGFDNAHDVAVGTDGVYFAGETNSFNANDAFVAKVDSNGTVLWARDWAALDRDGLPGLTSAFGIGTTADGVVITGNASDVGTLNNTILVKYNSTGALVWQKIGGPGFGGGLDVAEAADGALFVAGSILADTKDPEVFGGFAFVAEFGADGRKKKASTWGGSPNESASGEGIAVSANGTIAVAGFVHAPPYAFGSASNSSRDADATNTDVVSTAPNPTGAVNTDPGGVVTTPIGSETYAGDTEVFFLRLRR